MSPIRNRFTPLQRVLHWLMAVCILAMLFIGAVVYLIFRKKEWR